MATWFSNPITWDPAMKLNPDLDPDPDNRLTVRMDPGAIEVTAMYDGFVVYRPKSGSPDTGNLELVFTPAQWPEAIQKFFNPNFPKLAHGSKFTELPPGRVVYLDLPKSKIKDKLHELILTKFREFQADNKKIHRVLTFIDTTTGSKTLRVRLKEAWDSTPIDSEKQKRVDAEIDKNLDTVFNLSASDPVKFGLPVTGADVLCVIGDRSSQTTVVFEIRNLYGEPLNPHFYLKNIGKTPTDLAPVPPFKAIEPSPRFRPTDHYMAIRIPKDGGAEFDGMTVGTAPYESKLIWTHHYDSATGTHSTSLEPRPGATVDVPDLDPRVASRVNIIWDTDNVWINKHAEIFQVPCELILATLFKEARPLPGGSVDMNSIRLEEIAPVGAYPIDYEDLVAKSKTTGSKLTKTTVETLWKLSGLWATNEKGLAYEPRKHEVKPDKLAKVSPKFPFDKTAPISTASELLKKISWEQLAEIVDFKPHLISTVDIPLPVLGKKGSQYHYDMLVNDARLGADAAARANVARIYWTTVGGVRNLGTEERSAPSGLNITGYPLPTNKDWPAITDPADATKSIKWEQLLLILEILRGAGVKKVPEATYVLQPLQSLGNYSYSILFARPELMRILGITADLADSIMNRYFALMTKDVVYVQNVGPAPGQPGIQKASSPAPEEYLTLPEITAVTQIYPGRVSIGAGQILLDTAARKVIPWIKDHYGDDFFTKTLTVSVPPNSVDGRVLWMWSDVWDNEEAQIALIAAYHKQNATIFWQSFKDDNDNKYKVGETMTRFDFPRVAAAYNAGIVRKPKFARDAKHPDVDWGLHTFGDYFAPTWSAITFAITHFDSLPITDNRWARVRLRPDLDTNSGMDTH